MAFASSSGTRVAYVAESTWGTTPATPTLKTLRVTNRGLRTAKTTAASQERRADRNVPDLMMLGLGAGGGYDIEWSYATLDDLLEGALFSDWSADILKNGITPHSYTFEETLELGTTDSFSRFPGTMVSRIGMSIRAQQVVTGSIELLSQKENLSTAIVSGATYTAANVNPISTASANVAGLDVGAITPVPRIMSLDLTIDNHLRERPEIGSLFSAEFGSGRCEVTGNMSCYFESNVLYQSVISHDSVGLTFTIGNATLKKYTFRIGTLLFGNGERVPGGNDQDVMVNIPFQAVYNSTDAASIKITRAIV